jgi:peptidoglycan/LPS O-acetylase OafA/YrhL
VRRAPAPILPESKIPSLDGLRAAAVGLVLLGHLDGTRGFGVTGLRPLFGDYANLGVRVFFVISGFLITRLLIEEYQRFGTVSLRLFYLRRFFRIVPVFIAFIGVMGICDAAGIFDLTRADFVHAITYTTNFQNIRSWEVGHLWSLAVEEQFYLMWPFIFRVAGVQTSMAVAAGCLAVGPASRGVLRAMAPGQYVEVFPSVADALAAGCLLAGLRERLWSSPCYRGVVLSPHLLWLAPVLLVSVNRLRGYLVGSVLGEVLLNLTIAVVIDRCVSLPASGPVRVLNSRPMIWIGLLSYSLYLWQQPFLNRQSSSWFATFPVNLILVFACAVASYYVLEQPFMRLRKKYRPSQTSIEVPSPAA